ncbi:hypothetical protein FisN_21Lh282 [Fistulifera solaris]|uniref:Helicase-associated domain-containing protein n=1 Tax=Fistulifera solaris TaxID=1519565 RepID=A0A1Z5KEG4_FISSO|nr:hypothetical protein FisN_21Lh282 [Fistulifera solaris]|eukprot:GAX24617.1 hypothetical protein FisN_21Lh282 [Fistulifera solaris]
MPASRGKRTKEAEVAETIKPDEVKANEGEAAADDEVAAGDDDVKLPPAKKARKAPTRGLKILSTEPGAFNNYLFQLLLFKAEKGNYHVPKEEYPELHAWLQHVKREYKNHAAVKEDGDEDEGDGSDEPPTPSTLTEDQIKVLQHLHVPLTSRGDEHWNRFFTLLADYKKAHGHILVPRLCEIPGLGDWVTDQRRQYKAMKQGQPSQLNKERKLKLESLGFIWQVRNRPEWDQRYNELLEYKEKNGDCKVPQHYKENKALGKWVAKQREQFKLLKQGKHSFLTEDRLEKLNNVGFAWQVRSGIDSDILADVAESAAAAVAPKVEEEGAQADQNGEGKVLEEETKDDEDGLKMDGKSSRSKKSKPKEFVAEV